MKKYITVSTLLVSLLIVAGVFLYTSDFFAVLPVNNQTENIVTGTSEWLTYTNTAGGYSIEYPSDLQPDTYDGIDLAIGGSGIETPANEVSVTLSPKGTHDWVINVRVDRVEWKTPDEWIAHINSIPGNGLKIQKHVNINGVDAIITESQNPANLYHKAVTLLNVFVVHDGFGYDISGGDEIASTTYEKVWGSFRLLPKK